MARIFISYRRDDSGYVAALLNEKLQERFGRDSVFFDIDHIPIGVDFRQRINDAVGVCDALVVVIGDRWLEARDERGNRRLDDPADYLRLEIEAAFKRDIPVVPVLVDKSTMPPVGSLPHPIQGLAHRNAAEIRAGRDFRLHLDRVVDALAQIVPAPSAAGPGDPPARTTVAGRRASRTRAPAPAREPRPGVRTPTTPPATVEQIKAALGRVRDKRLFLGKASPSAKARNAIAAYATRVKPGDILLLYDNTLLGGARDGLLMTGAKVYWRNSWLSLGSKSYQNINKVDVDVSKVAGMNIVVDGVKISTIADGDVVKVAHAIADVLLALSKAARRAVRRNVPSA